MKDKSVVIKMPLVLKFSLTSRKEYAINLNKYRNWDYRLSNDLKHLYKKTVEPQLVGLKFNRIGLRFVLFNKDKRKSDRANKLSIHEKFFCDALVEFGCLPDDSDQYIDYSHYSSGEIDKKDPRVEIFIEDRSE